MLAHYHISKFQASAELIPTLDRALAEHQLKLSDLAFIAANYGPGPFTTLRTVIATLNGIAFASTVKLVGVDGLLAFITEYKNPTYDRTICMLNAFGHDVYYAYYDQDDMLVTGSANGEQFLKEIATAFADAPTIQWLGNAIATYRPLIDELFGTRAIIPEPIPHTCSIQQIGLMGLAHWERHENVSHQLMPHYLKTQQFSKCS